MDIVDRPIADLRPHPRNYRSHPADQIKHLAASVDQHGYYRPVILARDGTILAGHGLVEAARARGDEVVPTLTLPIDADSPAALKVLTGDNMMPHLSADDDRALTDLLREIAKADSLLGTGLDEQQLAALAYVTRTADEIATKAHGADWVGLPEHEQMEQGPRLIVTFETPEQRDAFLVLIGSPVILKKLTSGAWTCGWPSKGRDDTSSVRFKVAAAPVPGLEDLEA